jgi:beta-lactamase class D
VINRRHVLGLLAAAGALPSRGYADVAPRRSEIREDLAKHFTDEGTVGTFVGYKVDDDFVIASDKDRSGEAKLPASTFKIPNSVVALETGVVGDPDKDIFRWDGVVRSIEAWNRDHTMRSAIAASAVPVYQEIARRIGAERMQKFVDLFEYGNRDIGGGIDQFWLTGNLRIDPVQQVDFVDRLRRGALPVSKRSQDWSATSCRSRKQAIPSSAPRAVSWVLKSASLRLAGWWGGPRRTRPRRCLRSISMFASSVISPAA